MKTSARHAPAKLSRCSDRRGVLSTWMIWIMLAAGVIVGCLFNIIWLSSLRNHAQNCATSAAIAAGHSYLSDDMLRSYQQPFEYDGRVARCKQAAITISNQYRGHSLPAITEQQVEVEWPATQGAVSDPAMLVPSRINVLYDGNSREFQVPLFFSGLTGLGSSRLGVRCGVTLEHAPAAFRPGRNHGIPMLPFAICDDILSTQAGQSTTMSGYWTANIESGKGQDNFSWNSETHQFESGPDGLPEVTVTVYSTTSIGSADAFIPMSFSTSQASTSIPDWIKNGLTFDDLKSLGRDEVSFPGSMPTASITAQNLSACTQALQKKVGEACLVCLCSQSATNGNLTSINLKRPVAARVVQVTNSLSGSAKVVLQPCILTTSTAITSRDPQVAANRYVYSVRPCY